MCGIAGLQDAKEYGSLEEVEDIEQFFKALQVIRSTQSVCTGTEQYVVTHPALLCALRPYQQESVRWMLHREQWRCSPECRLASRYALYGWLVDKSIDLTHSAGQTGNYLKVECNIHQWDCELIICALRSFYSLLINS